MPLLCYKNKKSDFWYHENKQNFFFLELKYNFNFTFNFYSVCKYLIKGSVLLKKFFKIRVT